MGAKSRIEWLRGGSTWNPLIGCTRVSPGCQHCYAERIAWRFAGDGQPYHGLVDWFGPSQGGEARWNGTVRLVESALTAPLIWRKPRMIFVNSMSDLFHEKVSDAWLDRIFAVMALADAHDFLILTKRPEHMRDYLTTPHLLERIAAAAPPNFPCAAGAIEDRPWPLRNVWCGVSVENQPVAELRLPVLQDVPTVLPWVSAEPLLGPLDLRPWLTWLRWIVPGGESGGSSRMCDLAWIRSLIGQAHGAGVPVFVKQTGSYPIDHGRLVPKSGSSKGGDPETWPLELRVREFPQ